MATEDQRQQVRDRLPALLPTLEVFSQLNEPLGEHSQSQQDVRAIMPDLQRIVNQTSWSVSDPPTPLEVMALRGATPEELREMTLDQQEMYYEQRLDSLEKENDRIAKERGYETVEAALATLPKPSEDRFKTLTIMDTERARLQGAKLLRSGHGDQLLQHTPLRAAASYEDDAVLDAILDRLPYTVVEVGHTFLLPEKGMAGIVRFVGTVEGMGASLYAGIELNSEFATLGENDGSFNGVRYFTTNHPTSGLFRSMPYHAYPNDDVADDFLTASAFEVAQLVQLVRDNNTLLLRLAIKIANCAFTPGARELARNVTAWDEDGNRDFELGDGICWCLHQDPTKDAFNELDICINRLRSVSLRVASLDVDAYYAVEPKIIKPAKFQACSACDITSRLEELPGTWINSWADFSTAQEGAEDANMDADVKMDDTPEPEADKSTQQRPSRLDSAVCSLVLVHQDGRLCRACAKHSVSDDQHHCRQLCRKCNNIARDEFYDANKKKRDAATVLGLLPEDCKFCIYRQLDSTQDDNAGESLQSVSTGGGNNLPSLDFLGRYDPDEDDDPDDDDFSASERSQSSGDEDGDSDDDHDDDDDEPGASAAPPITSSLSRKRRPLSPLLNESPKKKILPKTTTSVQKQGNTVAPSTTSVSAEAAPLKSSDVHDAKTAKQYYADHIKKNLFSAHNTERSAHKKEVALNDVRQELAALQSIKDAGAAYWDRVIRDVQKFIADSEAKAAKKARDVAQKKADKDSK